MRRRVRPYYTTRFHRPRVIHQRESETERYVRYYYNVGVVYESARFIIRRPRVPTTPDFSSSANPREFRSSTFFLCAPCPADRAAGFRVESTYSDTCCDDIIIIVILFAHVHSKKRRLCAVTSSVCTVCIYISLHLCAVKGDLRRAYRKRLSEIIYVRI